MARPPSSAPEPAPAPATPVAPSTPEPAPAPLVLGHVDHEFDSSPDHAGRVTKIPGHSLGFILPAGSPAPSPDGLAIGYVDVPTLVFDHATNSYRTEIRHTLGAVPLPGTPLHDAQEQAKGGQS
jgi:hypothetical protein